MHYVDYLDMYSLDFEEFLWANGIRAQSIEDIRGYFDRREPVPDAMHQKMMVYYFEKMRVWRWIFLSAIKRPRLLWR